MHIDMGLKKEELSSLTTGTLETDLLLRPEDVKMILARPPNWPAVHLKREIIRFKHMSGFVKADLAQRAVEEEEAAKRQSERSVDELKADLMDSINAPLPLKSRASSSASSRASSKHSSKRGRPLSKSSGRTGRHRTSSKESVGSSTQESTSPTPVSRKRAPSADSTSSQESATSSKVRTPSRGGGGDRGSKGSYQVSRSRQKPTTPKSGRSSSSSRKGGSTGNIPMKLGIEDSKAGDVSPLGASIADTENDPSMNLLAPALTEPAPPTDVGENLLGVRSNATVVFDAMTTTI